MVRSNDYQCPINLFFFFMDTLLDKLYKMNDSDHVIGLQALCCVQRWTQGRVVEGNRLPKFFENHTFIVTLVINIFKVYNFANLKLKLVLITAKLM